MEELIISSLDALFSVSQVCNLLKHQSEGVAWLKSREQGKKRGGILADDMGLGKVDYSHCHS